MPRTTLFGLATEHEPLKADGSPLEEELPNMPQRTLTGVGAHIHIEHRAMARIAIQVRPLPPPRFLSFRSLALDAHADPRSRSQVGLPLSVLFGPSPLAKLDSIGLVDGLSVEEVDKKLAAARKSDDAIRQATHRSKKGNAPKRNKSSAGVGKEGKGKSVEASGASGSGSPGVKAGGGKRKRGDVDDEKEQLEPEPKKGKGRKGKGKEKAFGDQLE